ncbi:hypothetical protein EDD29_3668 [Actinocorallia herbida]|uniref:DUF6603 domain-containing protein n=1 Tax=Actinocorallia herbida TaxID=58109 RepID=A0A3N1CXY5_9ACTN|nr:DUF6603 domain-containing protein [Actinocorallia herbida]ROO86105.1 hypothetical protein EDD29_3668 [Actinocorallia herbida]
MNPDELRAAVVLTGTRLDLAIASLNDPGLHRDLGPHLVLTGATRVETAEGVTVEGTAEGGPFAGLSVTAVFAEQGALVTGRTPDGTDWMLREGFPALADGLLGTLRFRTPVLARTPAGGFDFSGDLVITVELAPLDLLVPGVPHTVQGRIVILHEIPDTDLVITPVPQVTLYGPEGATLELGPISLGGVRYEFFGDPVLDRDLADLAVDGRLVVTGAVTFTSFGAPREVLISAEIRGWGDPVLLTTDLRSAGRSAFADVVSFLHPSGLDVPGDFEITAPVVPTELTLLLDPAGPDLLTLATLTLETDETWDAGALSLQAVDVTFQVATPLSDPQVSVLIDGLVGIGAHGVLELSAEFGDGVSFGGGLREGDPPLEIGEVYRDFTGLDDAGHLPYLAVEEFRFGLALPPDEAPLSASGQLELEGTWTVLPGVELHAVEFALEVEGERADFTAVADLWLFALGLRLSASYDGTAGWVFEGVSHPGQEVPVGELIASLADRFGAMPPPAPIQALTVHDLETSFATGDGRFTFAAGMLLPVDTTEVDLTVDIDTGGADGPVYGGRITVGEPALVFDVHFAQGPDTTRYAASYARTGTPPPVREIVGALVPSAAEYVPDGLVIDVRDAVLASDGAGHVLVVDLKAVLDLSGLPVVGPALTGDGIVGFDPLRVIAAGAALAGTDLAALNPLLPESVAPLPEHDLPEGFTFAGLLRLGPLDQPMALPVAAPPASDGTPARPSDDVAWHPVQRSFGPVHVDRVGLSYLHAPGDPARLAVLVDGAISVGGLTLSCSGLSAAISLADPTVFPDFDLAGLGLSYAQGPISISGAFREGTVSYRGHDLRAYSGSAALSTGTFSIGALGSYVQLDEGPSLFVHAFLDHPIGGPAFFFVRGLAAGFGYNRRFVAPPVDRIADFPLVAEAIGTRAPENPAAELQRMEDDLPPSPGDFFLAFGVHFTSFEMIDSFLLVTAGFGHRFELDVLGVSTLILPAPEAGRQVTPVAEIRLALRAVFAPEDGFFVLQAQLTPDSYLFSRACRLTGGFAFATWFGDAHHGDFVLTVGGYHPHFDPPGHYPAVPRLGFSWQVNDQLSLQGSAYYAMTPAALMAGAALSATWEDGSLRAWFDASIDFLIAWQPYHYEASFHLSVGASYTYWLFGTQTLTMHVGTDVSLWGPEFGGTATIDLGVISFTIAFGESSGASPDPVPWDRFRAAQLPEAGKIVTIAVRGGVVRPGSGDDLGVLDPAGFRIGTDAVVPSTRGLAGPAEPRSFPPPGSDVLSDASGSPVSETVELPGTGTRFGVAPVGLAPDDFASVHHVSLTRAGADATSLFRFEPAGKNLPAALWGTRLTPSLTDPALIENALTGYTITPVPPHSGRSVTVLLADLTAPAALFTERNVPAWHPLPVFRSVPGAVADPRSGAATRATIAGKLLPDADLDLAGFNSADLLAAPEVARA